MSGGRQDCEQKLEVRKGAAEDDEAQIALRKQIRGNRVSRVSGPSVCCCLLLILATWTMGSDKKMIVRAAPKLRDVKLEHAVYLPLHEMKPTYHGIFRLGGNSQIRGMKDWL